MKKLLTSFIIFLFLQPLLSMAKPLLEIEPWGKDSGITQSLPSLTHSSKFTKTYITKQICIQMIRFFQQYISPIDGPRSHFTPSSSHYTLEAIEKYGILQGICLGCDRLMRENNELWIYQHIMWEGSERKLNCVPPLP